MLGDKQCTKGLEGMVTKPMPDLEWIHYLQHCWNEYIVSEYGSDEFYDQTWNGMQY